MFKHQLPLPLPLPLKDQLSLPFKHQLPFTLGNGLLMKVFKKGKSTAFITKELGFQRRAAAAGEQADSLIAAPLITN